MRKTLHKLALAMRTDKVRTMHQAMRVSRKSLALVLLHVTPV